MENKYISLAAFVLLKNSNKCRRNYLPDPVPYNHQQQWHRSSSPHRHQFLPTYRRSRQQNQIQNLQICLIHQPY